MRKVAAQLMLLCAACAALAAEDVPSPDPARWEGAISEFEDWDRKNSTPKDAVLFTGSSSIVAWSTSRDFPQYPVINRGFGGSHLSDVNHFFARIVAAYRPRVIVLYAGDNDIADGKSPQRIHDDYEVFVGLVRNELPHTHVIFISIKPSLARWSAWPRMRQANSLIRELSDHHEHLHFADIATPMLGPDGKPRPGLFAEDGLHLGDEGYRLWTSVVTPFIELALARPDRTKPPTVSVRGSAS